MDPEIQDLYAQKQSLEVVDGILYRNYVRPDGSLQLRQVVVPRSLRVLFIDTAHCGPLNEHLGIDKTQAKLKQFAYWRGWTSDVMLQVKRCIATGLDRSKDPYNKRQAVRPCRKSMSIWWDQILPAVKDIDIYSRLFAVLRGIW